MIGFTMSLRLEEIRLRHGKNEVKEPIRDLRGNGEENPSNSERSTSDSLRLVPIAEARLS